jgi:hypothetical protein
MQHTKKSVRYKVLMVVKTELLLLLITDPRKLVDLDTSVSEIHIVSIIRGRLGDAVVSVLATGPKLAGSNPAKAMDF